MRLSERVKTKIITSLTEVFGQVDIFLFGSRVNDRVKGGDIDLTINVDISREEFRQKKVKFISFLVKQNFDIKIDLIHFNQVDSLLLSEIESTGI